MFKGKDGWLRKRHCQWHITSAWQVEATANLLEEKVMLLVKDCT
jgi:hypothetical protein